MGSQLLSLVTLAIQPPGLHRSLNTAVATNSLSMYSLLSRRYTLAIGGMIAVGNFDCRPALARTPGSQDVGEAITQIKDAAQALRELRANWDQYAVIDAEGRAGNIDAARRVLGGVAPQRGDAAIAVAEITPLYRIDGAFAAVRKAALNDVNGWGSRLDIEEFVETGENIVFALKKADDSFYGVVFASKGSAMLTQIYREARASVDQAIVDFRKVMKLLHDAGAPGV